jgi:hypothetical protein
MHKIPQALRQDENPLPVGNFGQQLLRRLGASQRRALAVAGRAGHAPFAGERDKQAVTAFFATVAHDAEAVHPAAQEGAQGILGAWLGSPIRSVHPSAVIVRGGPFRATAQSVDPAFNLIADEPV